MKEDTTQEKQQTAQSGDAFADIADNKIVAEEAIKEVMPRPLPKEKFKVSKEEFPYDRVRFPGELSYEERLEAFQEDLANMREYYKPFMSDRLERVETGIRVEELKNFSFRYLESGEIFSGRNASGMEWEELTIPDYRGPAGEQGKWKGYYRTDFTCMEKPEQERILLQFQCVDYIARVYVNGCFVGSHEGLFAPFAFDITDYVSYDTANELYVEVSNDIPTLGVGAVLDGDKLYGATGPGWDDCLLGWHHCPAGAGIFGKVTVEYRPCICVTDIFMNTDIDNGTAQIRIGVMNYTQELVKDYRLKLRILPKNFQGAPLVEYERAIDNVGVGQNEYRMEVSIEGFRLWEPETPWLYGAIAALSGGTGVSRLVETVGVKKFISDESSTPKGRFYLNNHPIILRGANEMGHLQQCVMQGDYDQLIDDILIAKLCNMNYYRVTQRPVQREIYDYFDMLGMMHQCDFPLFGFLRRPQFAEAIRQTVEMEHLIRSHVSTVMVTFINEPMSLKMTEDPNFKSSKRNLIKGHRHLLRDELEAFFVAARQAIYTENPSRVVKNVEGDYEPPTGEGMPDFHCYTMWYSNHGVPIGKLMAGYLPAVKEGWMLGCGEYGAEGLDSKHIMETRYPKEWIACDAQGHWYPDRIVRSQTLSLQGDWYPEQNTMEDWIRESQIFQAKATRIMTDAFRRRADLIEQTAIHLLIDAWPSGWMKTLVDCERVPKRAYFAYADSLIPVRINLNTTRKYVYGGETVSIEVWALNDSEEARTLRVLAGIRDGENVYELTGRVEAASSVCMGILELPFPQVKEPTLMQVVGCMENWPEEPGAEKTLTEKLLAEEKLYGEKLEFVVYPDFRKESGPARNRVILPPLSGENAAWLEQDIIRYTAEGKTVVLLWGEDKKAKVTVQGETIGLQKCQEVFFAASTPEYEQYHLDMLYNETAGYIDILGSYAVDTKLPGICQVYTYEKGGFDDSKGVKKKLPFVKELTVGEGKLLVISLETAGRTGVNANLDALIAGRYHMRNVKGEDGK